MKLLNGWWLAAALLLFSSLRPASAQTVIFSNLGPGDSFNTVSATPITGEAATDYNPLVHAAPFTVGENPLQFGSVELALKLNAGANGLIVRLMSDNGGVPGAVLENIAINSLPTSAPALVTATSSNHTPLSANTRYWISPIALGNTEAGWHASNLGVGGYTFMARPDGA